jgi:hypothetical protein
MKITVSDPRSNLAEVERLISEVREHPMCLHWRDDHGVYLVIYPEGYYPNGVQAAHSQIGKAEALRRMLNAMERHWKRDLLT